MPGGPRKPAGVPVYQPGRKTVGGGRLYASGGALVSPTSPLYYADRFGLNYWFRADMGVTLGATLLASGTTPPAVTIAGSTTQQIGLYINIDGAGDETTATFRWSPNNGTTFTETAVAVSSSPYLLPGTGITATFAVGTYNTDNIYQATVSGWDDASRFDRDASQSTAARQPRFILSDTTGRPCLAGDGVDDFMTTASFTTAQPQTVLIVGNMVTAQAAASNHDTVWSRGATPFLIVDSTPRSILGAGSNITYSGIVANTVYAVIEMVIDGASGQLLENGVVRASGSVGSDASGTLTLFSLNSGTSHSTTFRMAEAIGFNANMPESVRTTLRNGLRDYYGI